MKFELQPLPYALNALEPFMSARTLEYHWGKHLATYITNLNNLKEGTEFVDKPLKEIIRYAEGPLYNNAAQTFNHQFFFNALSASPKKRPEGTLLVAIKARWGSFEGFVEEFNKQTVGVFGSGWGWLSVNAEGALEITGEGAAGNPLKRGAKPILCIDVWEHAYYLDYQNRRPDFVKGVWDIIDWAVVEKRFEK